MKKFTLLLTALLITSFSALAQIKLVVCQEGGARSEFIASSVDSIIFVGLEDTPDVPVKPDDTDKPEEEKPDTPVVPGTGSFVAKPFSVSATKTVTFSPGNLQYHAVNDEWRFAPNQTDYIGYDNANISSTYNGWIDLFGWGTGNNPTNKSTYYGDYQTFVDWGVNKIGSYSPNTWRTLTYDEWYYLRWERPNYDKLIGVAQVNGVNGLILLPDSWQCPNGVTFKSGFDDDYCTECYGNYQTISAADWSKLESSGAVFLPAAGYRYGSSVNYVQGFGCYWSATEGNSDFAFSLYFYSGLASMRDDYRSGGLSVRLVQDVATDPDDDPVAPPVKPDDGDDDIDTPEVELPGEGKIRFLIDATAVGACYGLGIEGNFCGYYPDAAFKGTEFAENMFYIDMPSMTAEEFGNAKILLLAKDGTSSWDYQVSSFGYELGEGADNYITIIDEFVAQHAINLVSDDVDNVVIPVKILAVEDTPCKEPIPAGRAKFVLTVTGKVPAGKNVIFTGSFEEKLWGESDRVMTKQADGTYVWEGAYPENFQFKAFIADCEDLGFIDNLGDLHSELWLEGADRLVELGSGSVIEFEGCFEFLCPEDDDPVVPGTGGFVAKPFSVSATKTVTFSPGNLQYHPANNEWRFAPSQTDYIGEDNANISSTYNGWIDLFGWGTGNNPAKKSTSNSDYQTFVDWGVNKIGNDAPNTWRTLTYDEWYYLRWERPNYDKLIGVAQVNGVNGLILLPDNWTCPSGVTFKSDFHYMYGIDGIEYYAAYQTFSASDWAKLEASGAVFFPASGMRASSDVYYVQYDGSYWSATENDINAYLLYFYSYEADMSHYVRFYGRSVRLVQD